MTNEFRSDALTDWVTELSGHEFNSHSYIYIYIYIYILKFSYISILTTLYSTSSIEKDKKKKELTQKKIQKCYKIEVEKFDKYE